MENRNDFNKVCIIGSTVICVILVGFPLLTYLTFKEKTQEV